MGSQSIWFPRTLSSLRLRSVLTNRQMEGEGEKISNGVKTDEFRSSKLAPNCFDNMWQKNLNTQPSCSSGTMILKDLMGNHARKYEQKLIAHHPQHQEQLSQVANATVATAGLPGHPTQLICISDIYVLCYVNRQIQKT